MSQPANGHVASHAEETRADEQACQAAGESRLSTSYIVTCLLGYSLSFVIFGSQVSILGPTVNPLALKLGVSEADLSPLFTALGVSCIASGPPSGWLVDRMPTHRVLVGALLVQALGFGLVPLMPGVWSLTALYALICFSYNFTNSAVFTSLGWMFPKRTASALNLVLAMFGVGSFCIPLAAQACKQLVGDPLAVFWVVSAMSLVATLPFLCVASPAPPPPELGYEARCPFNTSAREMLLERVVTVSMVLLVFFTTAAETAVGNWIYTYAVREAGLSDDAAALANSVFWAAFTIGRILGAAASHHVSPSSLLLGFTPLAVLGASLPLWAVPLLSPWWLVTATAALAGFGNATGYANAVSLLELFVPVTGFINGVFGMVAGAACMVGPTAVALLAKYTPLNYTSMAWVGTGFYLLHFPAIFIALAGGARLSALQSGHSGKPRDDEAGITEPLLDPGAPASSTPTLIRYSSRQSADGSSRHVLARHASIPGHASPIARSMG